MGTKKMNQKKFRLKPQYKKLIQLRKNAQNKQKVLLFQKAKWKKFNKYYLKQQRWFNKYKPKYQNRLVASKFPNRYNSYKQNFKSTLVTRKIFDLFYGFIGKKNLKRTLVQNKKKIRDCLDFIKVFEHRLDVVLYRARFCHSMRSAQQYIVHGKVFVNGKVVYSKNYLLKPGDLVSVSLLSLERSYNDGYELDTWPIFPKHLIVNYRTAEIIFTEIKHTNLSASFPFYFNSEKIITDFMH